MPLALRTAEEKDRGKRSRSGRRQISSGGQQQPPQPQPQPQPQSQPLLDEETYQAMERHLAPALLVAPRGVKLDFMRGILERQPPSPAELRWIQKRREYKERILSSYQPLHSQIYSMSPSSFFVPTFLQAISGSTEESLLNVITEPAPGVCAFAMLQPTFCEMLMAEVDNFLKWAHREKQRIVMPNTIDKLGSGAALSDFGLDEMLDDLMKQFISPISTVLYPEVGGQLLDTQHSFVVGYGEGDNGIGFHVDDCELTLNVCLGQQFTGGDMYFSGIRCVNHVNSEVNSKEYFQCPQVPGQALLHCGRHRSGTLPTTSGVRVNFTMWCRSSTFREMMKYRGKDFSDWCGKCFEDKCARQAQDIQGTSMAGPNIQPPN